MRVVGLMDIGPAHGNRANAEQHVAIADVRNRDGAQLHRERRQRILDNSRLGHNRATKTTERSRHPTGFKYGVLRISLQMPPSTSRRVAPSADLKSSGSITSGAPSTTSGAPREGHSIASRIDNPPTACTGTDTARTTLSSSSIGL